MTATRVLGNGLTAALLLCSAMSSALGQLTVRRSLTATPLRPGALAGAILLSVRGAPQGARYRYVAAMTATTSSTKTGGAECAQTQSIGSGVSVTWRPVAGAYRLTAYGPLGRVVTDTLSLTHVVPARRVMLASAQMPAQNDSVWLLLRTDDLGPGHVYQWWMQYRGQPIPIGNGRYAPPPLSQPWMAQTTGPTATYPTAIRPPTSIRATVSIHRGDPCEIIAAGSIPANQ